MNGLISRREVRMTNEEAIDVLKHNYPSSCFEDLCEAVDIAIKALSAEPQRKNGKWIEIPDEVFASTYKCSVCGCAPLSDGYDVDYALSPYCPHCGADMREEDQNG